MCYTNLRFTYLITYLLTYLLTPQGDDNNVVGDDNDHDAIELMYKQL